MHGGSSIAPDDSVSLVSGRPRAYEHKTAELGKYLGLLCLKREELSELMDNKFAVLKEYSMALDYDRDAIFQKKVEYLTHTTYPTRLTPHKPHTIPSQHTWRHP